MSLQSIDNIHLSTFGNRPYFIFENTKLTPAQTLTNILLNTMKEISDIKVSKVILASIRILGKHAAALLPYLRGLETPVIEELLEHLKSKNKKLRYTAANSLECFTQALADHTLSQMESAPGPDRDSARDVMNYLILKFRVRVQKSEQPLELMTCIRSMGFFAKGLAALRGQGGLQDVFAFLIENSQSRLISKFDRLDNFSFEHNTQNFKTVLFNQNQLNSYLKCFALITQHMPPLDKYQVEYVLRLLEMAFKYYLNYFPPYRIGLHFALVECLRAFKPNIQLSLCLTTLIEKLFKFIFASATPQRFHNLVFFAQLFKEVFDSSDLPADRKRFVAGILFDRVTLLVHSADVQRSNVLAIFLQELFLRSRFSSLMPLSRELFENLANALEKKVLKDPLRPNHLVLLALLLKLRDRYFTRLNISFDAQNLKALAVILNDNVFRLSPRARLTALECLLDMPLSFYNANHQLLELFVLLSSELLKRQQKSLYLVERLVDKLSVFTARLSPALFASLRGAFFQILMGCLSFQLSLSLEDKLQLESHFDSSLVKPGVPLSSARVKAAPVKKIDAVEQKAPILARSNLLVYNLADFEVNFEGIFQRILLIFKLFQNRTGSGGQRAVVGLGRPLVSGYLSQTQQVSLSGNKKKQKLLFSLKLTFQDLLIETPSALLYSLFISPESLRGDVSKKVSFAKDKTLLYFLVQTLHSLCGIKDAVIRKNFGCLKRSLKSVLAQAFSKPALNEQGTFKTIFLVLLVLKNQT